jgi:hypothetical protein
MASSSACPILRINLYPRLPKSRFVVRTIETGLEFARDSAGQIVKLIIFTPTGTISNALAHSIVASAGKPSLKNKN